MQEELKNWKRKSSVPIDEIDSIAHLEPMHFESVTKKAKKIEKESGIPVVCNTSFNVWGEPIVCTPVDALVDFFRTGLDALAIGNFLLQKNNI